MNVLYRRHDGLLYGLLQPGCVTGGRAQIKAYPGWAILSAPFCNFASGAPPLPPGKDPARTTSRPLHAATRADAGRFFRAARRMKPAVDCLLRGAVLQWAKEKTDRKVDAR